MVPLVLSPSVLKLKLTGNVLGDDPAHPEAIVVANGGASLIYLPGAQAAQRARDIAAFLATQDYVSGLFVNDRLGKIPGALAMSDVNLIGSARTPVPDIYVNFRTFAGRCGTLQCVRGVYGNGGSTAGRPARCWRLRVTDARASGGRPG